MFGPDPNAGCPVSRDLLARMDNPPARAPQAAPATI
jgi:nitrate reductase delta subunit